MLQLLDETKGDLAAFRISGQVDKHDYDIMLPVLEEKIKQYGKIKVYAELQEVDEYSAKALWKDVKFDVKHATDFSKAAIVGDQKWLNLLSSAASPFTSAEVKHFDTSERAQALAWVND
ncbi:STAS/SEC14 domain-containing protein [Pontibacter chitinilyticus]|uniref:STAS/SEC14 domain-containing protein n=1 Tax=Pontibacter chitinilyticus TaxID=2674989 RepID=UPI00321A9B1D